MQIKLVAALLITSALGIAAIAMTDLKHGLVTAAFVLVTLAIAGH